MSSSDTYEYSSGNYRPGSSSYMRDQGPVIRVINQSEENSLSSPPLSTARKGVGNYVDTLGSDERLGIVVICLSALCLLYYTVWIVVLPFVDQGHILFAVFPSNSVGVASPLLCLVLLLMSAACFCGALAYYPNIHGYQVYEDTVTALTWALLSLRPAVPLQLKAHMWAVALGVFIALCFLSVLQLAVILIAFLCVKFLRNSAPTFNPT